MINFNLAYDSLCHLRWYQSAIFSHLAHGLSEERTPQFENDKPKGHFTSPGSNYLLSLDSHDKLMGFRNITFPITIYGCIDTFSRKVLWAKVWIGNTDPKLIAHFYIEHLFKTRIVASRIRLNKGDGHNACLCETETWGYGSSGNSDL